MIEALHHIRDLTYKERPGDDRWWSSSRLTCRQATGTDRTDLDLRPLNQQGLVLMLTR
jgi:hypothetical protein